MTAYGHTWIEGEINIDEGELLFTTIPYEKGWTAYVDGKKAEILPAQNTYIAVRTGAGKHAIRLKYYVPGFAPSLAVSLLTLVGILIAAYVKKRKA